VFFLRYRTIKPLKLNARAVGFVSRTTGFGWLRFWARQKQKNTGPLRVCAVTRIALAGLDVVFLRLAFVRGLHVAKRVDKIVSTAHGLHAHNCGWKLGL
jgi:hypothetical protein